MMKNCHHYLAKDGARNSHNDILGDILSDGGDGRKNGMRSSLSMIFGFDIAPQSTHPLQSTRITIEGSNITGDTEAFWGFYNSLRF
jgi:hypothetical protein